MREDLREWLRDIERDDFNLEDQHRELRRDSVGRWPDAVQRSLYNVLHGANAPLRVTYQQLISYAEFYGAPGVLVRDFKVSADGETLYLAIYQGHAAVGNLRPRLTRVLLLNPSGELVARAVFIKD